MIRAAEPQDVDFISDLAVKVAKIYFPDLVTNRVKIREVCGKAISSPQCKTLISYDEEGPKGALVALSYDGDWFERKVSSLSLVWTPIRGDGLKMLRCWLRFAKSRPAFKVVEVGFPVRGDLLRILRGIGMRPDGLHLVR